MFRNCAQSVLKLSSRSTPRLFLRAQSTNALTNTQVPFTFSKSGPLAVKYTSQHEWIAAHEDGTAFVGITKYAADALGDATYVELPDVDTEVEAGDSLGSLESVKSASEIYSPLAGTVVEVNETLNDSPQLINEDPMGEAWLAKLKLRSLDDLSNDDLMSLEQYEGSLKEDQH
ncbi:LADA_0A08570g1_1 [Lachancea dasiensis]|uniref:Glycine cleavage system H protein n=1 Tax=Lachancea dasiensis TaxID=1072105 RepID=A0A1G4IQE2_9SACH|nr:LADA_0A08570g1_1 [Lachancea dasiensis]